MVDGLCKMGVKSGLIFMPSVGLICIVCGYYQSISLSDFFLNYSLKCLSTLQWMALMQKMKNVSNAIAFHLQIILSVCGFTLQIWKIYMHWLYLLTHSTHMKLCSIMFVSCTLLWSAPFSPVSYGWQCGEREFWPQCLCGWQQDCHPRFTACQHSRDQQWQQRPRKCRAWRIFAAQESGRHHTWYQ